MATPTLVQKVSYCGTDTNLVTQFTCRLPNPVLSGNMILLAISTNTAASGGAVTGPSSVTDDQSNTYTQFGTGSAGTNRKLSIWYLLNCTNAPQKLIINYSGGGGAIDTAFALEYYNIATSSATDGSALNTGTPAPIASGNHTTTADGDLILHFGVLDDTGIATTYTGATGELSSFTPATGFRMLYAEIRQFGFIQDQVQTTHGTNSYSVSVSYGTSGATTNWVSFAVAFKNAAAGTAPTPGHIHIIGAMHFNVAGGWSDTHFKFQLPALGNAQILVGCTESGPVMNTIADNVSGTWTIRASEPSDHSIVQCQHADLINGGQSDTNIVTVTYSTTLGGGEPHVVFDVENVLQYDTRGGKSVATASGTAQGVGATTITDAAVVTPTKKRNLIIAVMAEDISTGGLSISDHSPGYFQSSNTTPLLAVSPIDDNDGFAVVYTTTAAQVASTWTKTSTSTIGAYSTFLAVYQELEVPYRPLHNNVLRRNKRFVTGCLM
jgi:hypothetical protein